jgi:hypothetical protein
MKRFIVYISSLSLMVLFTTACYPIVRKAVCSVPVADLVGTALKHHVPRGVLQAYTRLPLAHKESPAICPRVHQLLFNEVVTVKEIQGDEVLIEIPNVFYELEHDNKPQQSYWTLKKNLFMLDTVADQKVLAAIPHPLITNKDEISVFLNNTVALRKPWYNNKTKTTYSAGTRFVRVGKQTQEGYPVLILHKGNLYTVTIPYVVAFVYRYTAPEHHIQEFVNLIRSWAHTDGYIPYVLGGCSIISQCPDNTFKETAIIEQQQAIGTVFERSSCNASPKAGLDCTGLIVRAAQLVGIPYFLKNSTTIAQNLTPLKPEDTMHNGDLIWIPGHVMVISDVQKGLLIEARHYYHGYGKVHEIPLQEQFKEMTNYHLLQKAFFEQKPLIRLNNEGNVVQVIPTFKILKFASVWQLPNRHS